MQPHAQEPTHGCTPARPTDLGRTDVASTALLIVRPNQNRPESQLSESMNAGGPTPTREENPFMWQQLRWILTHGMWP